MNVSTTEGLYKSRKKGDVRNIKPLPTHVSVKLVCRTVIAAPYTLGIHIDIQVPDYVADINTWLNRCLWQTVLVSQINWIRQANVFFIFISTFKEQNAAAALLLLLLLLSSPLLLLLLLIIIIIIVVVVVVVVLIVVILLQLLLLLLPLIVIINGNVSYCSSLLAIITVTISK